MSTTTFWGVLRHYACDRCGTIYGLEENFDNDRRASGKSFYCPNGHSLSYHETTTQRAEKAAKRAQELLDIERRRHEETKSALTVTERRRAAERGQRTKLQNRIKHGVCPCCNRTFAQLAEHMKAKHPEFLAAKEPTA